MATVRRTNKNPVSSGFLSIIERYWIVLLGLVFAVPMLFRYLKDSQTADTVNNAQENIKALQVQNLDVTTQLQGLNKITTRLDIQNIARNTAINLGVVIGTSSWLDLFNYKTWTENDQLVFDELKKIKQPSSVILTAKCYQFLTSRNLMDDVKKYLDSELLAQLPLFK